MSDRFDDSVRDALRRADLPVAPDRLYRRLEGLAMETTQSIIVQRGRRGRPVRLAFAGLVAAALVAVAVLGFWLPTHAPFAGTQSSATPSASSSESSPLATPRATPTPGATPTVVTLPQRSPPPDPAGSGVEGDTTAAVWFAGRFVVVGHDRWARNGVWLGDGRAWQRVEVPALTGVTVDWLIPLNGRLFAIGWNDAPPRVCPSSEGTSCNDEPLKIAYTDDGRTWTGLTPTQLAPFGRGWIIAAAGGASGLVAYGHVCSASDPRNCTIETWHSADGLGWSPGSPFPSGSAQTGEYDIKALVATSNGFVGVPGTASSTVWYSADGATWTKRTSAPSSGPVARLLSGTKAGVVAVFPTTCPTMYAVSPDGSDWSKVGAQPSSAGWCGAPSTGDYPILAGDGDRSAMLAGSRLWLFENAGTARWTDLGSVDGATAERGWSALAVAPGGVLLTHQPEGEVLFVPTSERTS